ncbi:hypothetical protein EJB05_13335, partial [Eragrostis curvula]
MGRRRGSKRTKASSAAGDRITGLPLELRARIASFLHYGQVVQLSALSRPWRHIHHHTPVVKIDLSKFLLDDDSGLLDEDSILSACATLGRRAQDVSASKVDTLRLACATDNVRMRHHADRIVALADAREIHIDADQASDDDHAWTLHLHPVARLLMLYAAQGHEVQDALMVHLPPAARRLMLNAAHQFVSVDGPGAAALRELNLRRVVLREWSHLPSLRSLNLESVTVEAPFAPGQWCPLLEELDIIFCKIEQARVDICLPHLRFLGMTSVDVSPQGQHDGPPFGHITVDAPEMEELSIWAGERMKGFKSFTLRAPKLQLLSWNNQFAERVHVDVGRPGSVEVGKIEFTSVYFGKIKKYWEQMMQMLQGLLPNVPPESVADIVRPYMTPEECPEAPDSDSDDHTVEKKLSCDLTALMWPDI